MATAPSPSVELADADQAIDDRQNVSLHPANWIGKPFPLGRFISGANSLNFGHWTIVVYSQRCGSCRTELPHWERLANCLAGPPGVDRIALVEVPPFAGLSDTVIGAITNNVTYGHLDAMRNWVVSLPTVIRTSDGIVTDLTSIDKEAGRYPDFRRTATVIREMPDYNAAMRRQFLSEVACGPLSLIAALEKLGVPLSMSDARTIISAAGTTGINMLQLQQLAESIGVSSRGTEITLGEGVRGPA